MVESDTATVRFVLQNDGTDFPAFGRLLQLQTVFIVTAAVYWSLHPNLNSRTARENKEV